MRLRTVLIVVVVLALLATMAALGVAAAIAKRDGWFTGFDALPFDGPLTAVAQAPAHRSFDIRAPLKLTVRVDAGDVRIVRGGTQATVAYTPTARAASNAEARRLLGTITPTLSYAGGDLTIAWQADAGGGRRSGNRSVDVLVRLPVTLTAAADIETRAGDVAVDGHRGRLDVETAFGDIVVSEAQGAVHATTAAGDIVATGLSAPEDPVDLRTEFGDVRVVDTRAVSISAASSSGDIVADRSEALRGAFTATTRFGDVRLDGVAGNPLTADSDSGDVHVGTTRLAGPLEAATRFGDVDVDLPAGSGASVTLHTRFGRLSAPFVTGNLEDTDGAEPVTGRIGAGGPSVSLTTDSGDVRLTIRGDPPRPR